MKLRIDVRNAAGVSYGAGPIGTAPRWTSTRRQDRAGTFGFEMPAGDARAALLAAKRYAHCMGMVNETYTEIGAGIIDRLGVAVGARGGPVLNISGDDLLRELAYRSVGDLELYDVAAAFSNPAQVWWLQGGSDVEFSPPHEMQMDDTDFLYEGHETRFTQSEIDVGTNVNDQTATLVTQYFNGEEWVPVSDWVDGTVSGGKTLAQDGIQSWTRPVDWKPVTHAGHRCFWIRRSPTAGLDTVTFNDIDIKPEVGSATPVADIMAHAPGGWTVVDANGSAEESDESAYLLFAGESVLTALMRLAEITGEHFRLGTGKQLVWLTSADASGFRAEAGGHGPSLASNEKVCLILELTKSEDNYEIISRIYPYGAGQGSGRVTLAGATNSYAGYTVNTADNYIEYDAADAEIHKRITWADIASPDDGALEAGVRAANQLADAAHEYLSKHVTAQTAYRMRVVKLDGTVYPGQTIRVVYRRFVDGYRAVDIDATLYVLEATTEVGPDGIRTVAMELATTNFWPDSDGGFITSTERRVSRLEAGEQPLEATRIAVQFSGNVDIDGGTMDGVTVGGDVPAAGTFTALAATGSITVGGTVDGVDLAGFNVAQFLTLAASGHMANERILAPGAGLTGTDGGAGAAYTLAVGAGDGIDVAADSVAVDVTDFIDTDYGLTENANNIRLKVGSAFTFSTGYLVHNFSGNPSTITPDASVDTGSSVYAARTDHVHAIVCAAPANPSVDLSASIEGSATSFARSDHEHQLDQAITPTWTGKHIFRHTTQPQVEIGYDAGGYLGITVYDGGATKLTTATDNSTGNLELEPAGHVILDPVGNFCNPETGYDISLGTTQKKYLKGCFAELEVETLVAQETIATIGGRILVGPTTYLTRDIEPEDTTIYVKHNEMTTGDRVYMEAHGWVEFMSIDSVGTRSANTLSNGGFETPGAGNGDIWANWTENTTNGELANETTFVKSGDDACKATYSGGLSYVSQDVAVTPGKEYRMWFWSRGDGSKAGIFTLSDQTNGVNLYYMKSTGNVSTTYGLVSRNFTAPPGCTTVRLVLYSPNGAGSCYYDDAFICLAEYSYTVTRNLDDSGANAWNAGDAVFNTGATGDGFIDIYSVHGIKATSEIGPSIAGNIRNSATYNDWTEHWAIGNLNGKYGYGTTVYGVAFGEYGVKDYITIESTNGIQFKDAAHAVRVQLTSGVWTLGNTSTEHVRVSSTQVQIKDGETVLTDIVGGAVTIGEVGEDLSNVYITAGDVALRVNEVTHILLDGGAAAITVGIAGGDHSSVYIAAGVLSLMHGETERVGLTAEGVLTINDSGGNAVITLDAALGAEITKKLTMPGAASVLSIGETPPTASDTGTGIWIDRTGMYGLAANVLQAKFDAVTGAITAGAGVVTLDVLGISVEVTGGYVAGQSYRLMEGATTIGCMYGRAGDEINDVVVQNIEQAGHAGRVIIQGESPETHSAGVVLQAVRGESLIGVLLENGITTSFRPTPSETVDLGLSTNLWENAYINKLYVGTGAAAGGIGAARLAIEGTNASVDGPHIQLTTATDDYPLLQILGYAHDNIQIAFDAFFDGAWKSGDAGSNFTIRKNADKLTIAYDTGIAVDDSTVIPWHEGMILGSDGGIHFPVMKTGTSQADAGAAEGELWAKSDDYYTVRLGQAV